VAHRIVASDLPCLEVSAHTIMLVQQRSPSAYFLDHKDNNGHIISIINTPGPIPFYFRFII
jgi:hypothetical protein